MDGSLRARRISGSICIGIALGILAWVFIPLPRPPAFLLVIDRIALPGISASNGPMIGRGVKTPEIGSARIVFAGDIMLDRLVADRTRTANDASYAFRKLPDGWFESFDYAVANLEGPVTDMRRSPVKSVDFLFDPTVIPVLKAQGIDAVSQANNHALDQGTVGYNDSVRRLREAGLLVFGHQVDDGPVAFATTTIHELRIAFLGFNTTDNAMNREQAASAIALAKEEADTVIASVHWGNEYRSRPDASSVQTAHWLIDQGVDVVIGGHPHWTQGISSYKDKPIAWSLGNFIFDQDFSTQTRQGLAVALTVSKPLASDFSHLTLEPIPIHIDRSQPRIVEGEERAKRLDELANISDESLRDQIRAGMIGF
ncbi:MAG: CapA family protein [Patescibacteria group bacterium]